MKWSLLAVLCVLPPWTATAQDSVVEITEEALNRIVSQMGSPSDGGVFMPGATATIDCTSFGYLDCPRSSNTPQGAGASARGTTQRVHLALCRHGDDWRTVVTADPVVWQWWVTDARFDVRAGSLDFSARVRYRVGDAWADVARSVGASVDVDAAADRLRLNVEDFKVPLELPFQGTTLRITEVDVAKLFGLSLRLEPQQLKIPTPNWPRQVSARAASATAQYLEGLVRINLELRFQ